MNAVPIPHYCGRKTETAAGAPDPWERYLADLPEEHQKLDRPYNMDDTDFSDDFECMKEGHLDGLSHEKPKDMKMEGDLDGLPHEKPKDMKIDADNNDECGSPTPKELGGGPFKKPKLAIEDNPEQCCHICDANAGQWRLNCLNKARELGLLCMRCERRACLKCLRTHRGDVLETVQWCFYCCCLGDHWEEECPVVAVDRRELEKIKEYKSQEYDSDWSDPGF